MGRKLANLILFVAAIQLAGGHWLALQSLAWAGMLISYSRTDSFIVAVEKTFGGNHPCNLCYAVKKGKTEEEKQQSAYPAQKLEAVLATPVKLIERKGSRSRVSIFGEFPNSRAFPPPTPPPLLS